MPPTKFMTDWRRFIGRRTSSRATWGVKPEPRSLPMPLFSSWKPARTFLPKPNLPTPNSGATASRSRRAGRLLLLLATVSVGLSGHAQNLKVTLLGTGAPRPTMDRFGPSILVEAGKEKLLFDCGRGAT